MVPGIDSLKEALGDRYRIEREIGQGGMATVYLAKDLKHDRPVAIKVLKPELSAMIGAERFLAEIKTTATLQHPHILPLFDSGQVDSLLYYVMPYVDGESLREKLDREKQLSIEEATRIATEVSEALEHAHGRGIIHRDIKPANILLQEGRAIVADFGIALAVSEAGGARLTETGLSLGTPHYMSPEQTTGDRDVDKRSDLYSLGCILHEMLAGQPPHTGPTAQSVIAKILTDEAASLSSLRKTVPANVESAVLKTLEKLPGDRFPDVGSFAAALRDERFRYPEGRGPVATGRRVSVSTIGLTAAVLIMAVLLWRSWADGPEPPPSTRYALNLGNDPAPTDYGMGVALSPDGTQVAYVSGAGSTRELWVKHIDQIRPRRLEQIDWLQQPFFSPDGDRVAWTGARGGTANLGLSFISLATGSVTQVAESGVWYGGGHWSEDGWLYVQADDATIVRFSESTFERQAVTTRNADEVEHLYPQALPGGAVLFTIWYRPVDRETPAIAVFDPDTRSHRVLTQGSFARYSETGHLLVVSPEGRLTAAPFDVDRLELEGRPIPVLDRVAVEPTGGVDLAVSRTGDMVFATLPNADASARELKWVDREGNARPWVSGWLARFESVAIAPDNSRVAVTVGSEFQGSIWIKRLDESPQTRLTFEPGMNRRPTWLPDSQAIGFISDRNGGRALFSKRVDGLGSADPVLSTSLGVDQAQWSSDGEWIVYRTGFSGGERDIMARRTGPDTTTIRVAANEGVDEHSPALSPDGRFVAYVSNGNVWVRPFPDVESGRWRVSSRRGMEPVWANSSEEVFFRTATHLVSAGIRLEPTFGVTRVDTLFSTEGYFLQDVHPAYDVSPDDREFLMIREPSITAELVLVTNIGQLFESLDN